MAIPYGLWGVPAMQPTVEEIARRAPNPGVKTLAREFAERATNGNPVTMAEPYELAWLKEYGKVEETRNIIIDVCKGRLGLGWPWNYKALDVLAVMPAASLLPLLDQLEPLADLPSSTTGAAHIKKACQPLIKAAKEEQAKADAEDAKKKQEAIAAMWGGLWANPPAPKPENMGWPGWVHPWPGPPGVPIGTPWTGKAPEGWTPASITAVPQVYPFSRAGYYGLMPPNGIQPAPTGPQPWWYSAPQ